MSVIYKYSLPINLGKQVIMMPRFSQILCLQLQDIHPMIWARVDNSEPMQERIFTTYGTGHTIPSGVHSDYIGTYQLEGLVFHVFEELRVSL